MRDWWRQHQILQTPNVASPDWAPAIVPLVAMMTSMRIDDYCIIVMGMAMMMIWRLVQPHSLFWKFTQSFGGAEGGRVGQSRALAFLSKPTIVRMRMRSREEKRMMISLVKSGKLFSEPASSSKTLITTFPSLQSKGNRNHLWSWYRWWWCGGTAQKTNLIIKFVSGKYQTWLTPVCSVF